jgi:pimeloyl-ACP methyl ester carboxylesterase
MMTLLFSLFLYLASAQELEDTTTQRLPRNPFAQCGSEKTEKQKWSYCIYRYNNHSQKVVYYFHGLLGDERDWERRSEKEMLAYWKSTGQQSPIIVSISFGKSWFLAEKNSSSKSGLYEIFSQKILPQIQNQFLAIIPEQNILLGFSMGGFNASQLYFKMPHVFSRAALICGAMATVSPHASRKEVEQYIQRTNAQSWRVLVALGLSRTYFPTENDWQKHSPVALAQQYLGPRSSPLYVSNGLEDEFGFHEGNLAFVDLAAKNGADVLSDFYPQGGHCDVDQTPIAEFLVQPPTQDLLF